MRAVNSSRFKFCPEAYDRMVAMYVDGAPGSVIEQEFGCSRPTIVSAVRRAGQQVRSRGSELRQWDARQREEVVNLRQAGWSQRRIARQFKAQEAMVSRLLAEAGLSTKSLPSSRSTGDRHHCWRGGRTRITGYIGVRIPPSHRFASMLHNNGYVLEHRLVMAEHLGRPLSSEETVHHLDGVRTHNNIANLQLRRGNHGAGVVLVCGHCGSQNIVERPLGDSV